MCKHPLHARVVKIAAAAGVAQAVGGQRVGRRTAWHAGSPEAVQHGDNTGADRVGHERANGHGSALVENFDAVAVLNLARLGIEWVDSGDRLAFPPGRRVHARVAGVQEVARGFRR